jgi:hypothetical protein
MAEVTTVVADALGKKTVENLHPLAYVGFAYLVLGVVATAIMLDGALEKNRTIWSGFGANPGVASTFGQNVAFWPAAVYGYRKLNFGPGAGAPPPAAG